MPEKPLATSPRIRELSQRLEKDPGSRAFLDLAKAYQAAGDNAGAARVCREGLTRHPRYHSARVLLGKVLLEASEFHDAIGELGRVVTEAPDNLLARRLLGEAQAGDGQRDQALETYRELLRLQPEDEEILSRIGDLERGTGTPTASDEAGKTSPPSGVETLDLRPDPAEAIESPYPDAMDEPPPPARIAPTVALDPSAIDLSQDDRPTEILDLSALGVEEPEPAPPGPVDPDPAPRGQALEEEARTVMFMAPELDQNPPEPGPPARAHGGAEALPTPTLAELYVEQGLPAEAEKVYVKLLEGDPENQEIRERLTQLRGGAPAARSGSARARIQALEGWLARIRRSRNAQGRA